MKDNTKVFEEYTIPKAVMTMALPSMLSMLINIVYNLADTFFVGQTGDSNQVAAVSVSMPLIVLTLSFLPSPSERLTNAQPPTPKRLPVAMKSKKSGIETETFCYGARNY